MVASIRNEKPNRPDDMGCVNKFTYITRQEAFNIIGKEIPVTTEEVLRLCKHYGTRVLEIETGMIFKPYDSK